MASSQLKPWWHQLADENVVQACTTLRWLTMALWPPQYCAVFLSI
jgi:hypothetical protein